jgi:hypothetical protein
MFHRIDEIRVAPTVYIVAEGDLTAVPSELVRVFGPPTSEPFDRESLGAFYFRGADEQPFMLYFRAHDLGWWSMRKLRSTFWLGREAREFLDAARERRERFQGLGRGEIDGSLAAVSNFGKRPGPDGYGGRLRRNLLPSRAKPYPRARCPRPVAPVATSITATPRA